MNSNMTCPHGNSTMGCVEPPNSIVGLSVGLTLLFILLGVGLAALLYTQRQRLRDLLGRGHTSEAPHTPEMEDYRGLGTQPQTAEESPIYQNVTAEDRRHMALDMSRSLGGQEEDLYLECDPQDDAIYSNDPSCSLTMLPPHSPDQYEDLYIVPDDL